MENKSQRGIDWRACHSPSFSHATKYAFHPKDMASLAVFIRATRPRYEIGAEKHIISCGAEVPLTHPIESAIRTDAADKYLLSATDVRLDSLQDLGVVVHWNSRNKHNIRLGYALGFVGGDQVGRACDLGA